MLKSDSLTEEQKSKIVSSVYSNPKKLMMATYIYSKKEATTEDITQRFGYNKATVSQALKEMEENQIVVGRRESYYVHYSLTEFGKKLVTLFN